MEVQPPPYFVACFLALYFCGSIVSQGEAQTRFRLAAGPASSEEKLARWPPPVSQCISILSLAMRWADRPRWRVGRMEAVCFFMGLFCASDRRGASHAEALYRFLRAACVRQWEVGGASWRQAGQEGDPSSQTALLRMTAKCRL